MKIEIINGLAPTQSKFTLGSFIHDRITVLHEKKIPFDVWMLESSYSKLVHFIYSLLKSRILQEEKIIKWDIADKQHIVHRKNGVVSTLINVFIPHLSLTRMASALNNEMCLDFTSVIHAHWIYPHGYVATLLAKKHNIPCIVTAHGSDIHTNPRKNRTIKKHTLKTLNSADKVIFVSQALLNSAKELGYAGENAVVIPNGIDIKYFYPMDKDDALKRTRWKQTKRYVVGFVGNMIPVKRADKFVEIFSEIQKQVLDVEFILVGDGDLADDIRLGASAAGLTVTFAGRVPHEDICYWMNLFDVMILPSRNEGWPCVVLEAFGCGTPVVGSKNGGVAEAIGGLCPSVAEGDEFEKRFADAVCDVLTEECPINTNYLISRAGECTWVTTVGKEIEVYLDLVKSGLSETTQTSTL